MTARQTESVDQIVATEMEAGSIPAVALAIVQGGRLILAKAYGMANLEHMVPATPHTVFKIASITKTITAAAIMMLVEQGEVRLDDPINRYLPHPQDTWKGITLRHLLTHTSGITNYEPLLSHSWQPDGMYEEVVRMVSELPLEFQPGDAIRYRNTNYIILGILVEQVSGTPYRDFVREKILAPVGMTETCWNNDREIVPNRAQGYAWDSETLQCPGQPPLRNIGKPAPGLWNYADGGLLSTVLDLARWDAALDTEKLLEKSSLEQMWIPARLKDGTALEYGLGWIVKVVEGHRNIGHWGRNPGFMAEMSRFVDDRLTVIALCNRWKADIGRLVSRIASLYVPGIAPGSLDQAF
jgi:CubicO group peptidase (beta-lactamase class C family)